MFGFSDMRLLSQFFDMEFLIRVFCYERAVCWACYIIERLIFLLVNAFPQLNEISMSKDAVM